MSEAAVAHSDWQEKIHSRTMQEMIHVLSTAIFVLSFSNGSKYLPSLQSPRLSHQFTTSKKRNWTKKSWCWKVHQSTYCLSTWLYSLKRLKILSLFEEQQLTHHRYMIRPDGATLTKVSLCALMSQRLREAWAIVIPWKEPLPHQSPIVTSPHLQLWRHIVVGTSLPLCVWPLKCREGSFVLHEITHSTSTLSSSSSPSNTVSPSHFF